MIPSGLSPPDFSAIKIEKEEEEENEGQDNHRNDLVIDFQVSWMSPLLNLSTPYKKTLDEKPIIPLAKKLNFNE